MPPWTTRWLVWARDNLLRSGRPRPVAASLGFERTGVTRWEAPVPWTADAAVLDIQLRVPVSARRKTDFALRLPSATFPADGLRSETGDLAHVSFRFPVPAETVSGDLLWKGRVLASVPVRVLTPGAFVTSLALINPTVAVRFGNTTVAVAGFVPERCDGLLATAFLRCATSLAPLAELGFRVVFRDSLFSCNHTAAVALGATHLARSEATVTAVCPELPRTVAAWWVIWQAGERALASVRVHTVPADRFDAGVRVLETRFALVAADGKTHTTKLPPALTGPGRVGPCFVLAGSEPGVAALCRFEVIAFASSAPDPEIRCADDAVITDGPTVFVPALFDVSDLTRVSGFELRLNGRLLGIASLRPVPAARLNAEGGFVPPPEFMWSAAADDELTERLKRLSE